MADDPMTGYPVALWLPILWGDQDAFRHVNNTVYLKWFETARIAYAGRVGLLGIPGSDQFGPIIASSHCDYRRPLTHPDRVCVGARVEKVGRTSLTFGHRVVGESAGAVAAEGTAVLVYYDYAKGEPVPVPESIREAIARLEAGEAAL